MLDRISGKSPCTSIHNELPEEEKKPSPKQEEEVLIAKSQSLQSQDLAISSELSISQNPSPYDLPREKRENTENVCKLNVLIPAPE